MLSVNIAVMLSSVILLVAILKVCSEKFCNYQGWRLNPRIFPGSVFPGSLLLSLLSSVTSPRTFGWSERQNWPQSAHFSSQWSSSLWLSRKIYNKFSVWNCLNVISDLFSLLRSSALLLSSGGTSVLPSHKAWSPTEIWLQIFKKRRTEEILLLSSTF